MMNDKQKATIGRTLAKQFLQFVGELSRATRLPEISFRVGARIEKRNGQRPANPRMEDMDPQNISADEQITIAVIPADRFGKQVSLPEGAALVWSSDNPDVSGEPVLSTDTTAATFVPTGEGAFNWSVRLDADPSEGERFIVASGAVLVGPGEITQFEASATTAPRTEPTATTDTGTATA